ncbi:hypothetical protein B0H17DRAFT_1133081 [Mycena rosella]|uniref:Uncharacterized protein n=1 Tax=Mycena rosella TaxID=1033263 RepID=A0AAD7GKV7_MYCRO|nr:hypothetical protein B0H17DRAFT_1133081 [Mycena rosella]
MVAWVADLLLGYQPPLRENDEDLTSLLRSMSLKQDRLEDEIRQLKNSNVELKNSNTDLQAAVARSAQTASDRGNLPSRGTILTNKKAAARGTKRGTRVVEPPLEPQFAPLKISVNLALDVPTELKAEFESVIKRAKATLQITGEVYLNPVFEFTVAHTTSRKLFLAVANQVESQFQENSLPSGLDHKQLDFKWDCDLVYEMSKTSFRSCKVQWRRQTDVATAAKEKMNQQMNRWQERQVGRLDKAVIPYAAKLQDDDDTSKAVWKTWMAFKHGYDNGSSNGSNRGVVEVKPFLEVMKCDWRAEEQKEDFHYVRIRDTDRQSPHIPERVLYNFGINRVWFEQYKNHPDCASLLSNWDKYPDAEGFGTNRRPAAATDTGVIEVGSDLESNAGVELNDGRTEFFLSNTHIELVTILVVSYLIGLVSK